MRTADPRTKTTGRQRFVCIYCGLRVSGRLRTDGTVYAYDRGPDSDAPPAPAICVHCFDQRGGE